ncbi:MAG: hypothetical protein JW997_05150 [Actinobacteria bacterium]|nr:hypothetical protein [Actinomycetota bacterium]
MSRKTIIILIAIAAIFAAIAFALFQKNPSIEHLIITQNADINEPGNAEGSGDKPVFGTDSQLYAAIFIKNAKPEDIITVKWSTINKGAEEIIQENSITLKDKGGSGKIIISFAKKDNTYIAGSYFASVDFKGQQVKAGFSIE